MVANDLDNPKVQADTEERKAWPVASTRMPKQDIALLDAAAAKLEVSRSDVVYSGTMKFVREVLGIAEAA